MNRRGIELPINFIIILILAIVVLIAVALYFNKGIGKFEQGTKPFLDVGASVAVKKSCELACNLEDKYTYCCKDFEIDKQNVTCGDSRLELGCMSCADYSCK